MPAIVLGTSSLLSLFDCQSHAGSATIDSVAWSKVHTKLNHHRHHRAQQALPEIIFVTTFHCLIIFQASIAQLSSPGVLLPVSSGSSFKGCFGCSSGRLAAYAFHLVMALRRLSFAVNPML